MSKLQLRRKMLLVSLLLLTGLIGCSKPDIVLHPIMDSDIFAVPKGTMIAETRTIKDGWFVSNYYIEEVMKIKVE